MFYTNNMDYDGKLLETPCKHLDHAAPYILSGCSFYLEFTSFADSIATKSYTHLVYKLLKTDLFHHGWTGSTSE